VDQTTWPQVKASGRAPFGQVPFLEVVEADGSKWSLAQGNAIIRFISKRHGHGGANDREEAVSDSLLERLLDFRSTLGAAAPWSDPERAQKTQKWLDEHWAVYNAQLDSFLAKGGPFLVGAKFTAADIAWYSLITFNLLGSGAKLNLSPHLQKWHATFEALPTVKEFLADASKNPAAKK
jgi:glutathione S-transferase